MKQDERQVMAQRRAIVRDLERKEEPAGARASVAAPAKTRSHADQVKLVRRALAQSGDNLPAYAFFTRALARLEGSNIGASRQYAATAREYSK